MHFAGSLTVGRAFTDHRTGNDQSRLILTFLSFGNRTVHRVNVMTVDRSDNIPTVRFKTFTGIVREPIDDFAVNGNAVVIINDDKLIEFPGTGQRADFVADAFHEATVT